MPSPTPIRLGRFDLHSILGQGGMGVVWEGIHRPNGTPVAVKVLRRDKKIPRGNKTVLPRNGGRVGGVGGPAGMNMSFPGTVDVWEAWAAPQ